VEKDVLRRGCNVQIYGIDQSGGGELWGVLGLL
jgi:hypothetical protein